MLIAHADTTTHTTPNAVMTTLAAPSLGADDLAVWRVTMEPGQAGPIHAVGNEQVWVILEGSAQVTLGETELTAGPGDTVICPAGTPRQVKAPEGLVALVATRAGTSVSTDEGTRPLPWAA